MLAGHGGLSRRYAAPPGYLAGLVIASTVPASTVLSSIALAPAAPRKAPVPG